MKNTFSSLQFRTDGEIFLNQLMAEAESLGLPLSFWKSDHLCFRVETLEQYAFYREALANEGELLTEALVNGRPIATYLLKEPFKVRDQVVNLIELPAPKPGADYKLGFEHAEFVIQESFTTFAAGYPHLQFSRSGNKNLNPELCLKMPSGQIKFHHLSLDRVIEIEKAGLTDIIFDLDGTLIQSREAIYEVNRIVFSEALEREVSLEESKAKFHPEFPKLFAAFEVTCPQKQKKAISAWGEVSERFSFPLFEGIKDLLENLSTRPFRLHLWTARDERSARAILASHDLDQIFTTMSFANEVHSKPHCISLKFDWKSAIPHTTLVIGDSPSDVIGAKNIGAIRVGALWDKNAKEISLISAGAELLFHELDEFKTWLDSKV
jgi:phosphoglycolate phosphatase-like HAD superfamily hydrolase/predicted metalloenzyme YecM